MHTTATLSQFTGKSAKNKSKSSQGGSSVAYGRQTSTIRPRTTTARSYLNPDGKNSNGNNNNNVLLKGDKLQPANSNIYEKSPGKAPKQVKEGSYTTPPADSRSTSHQSMSMSKMFERYEKIERIYPELKPYKDNNNPAYFTVTNGNGKPSRENSKSFSSFVSVNSAPQKKNSQSEISTVARQQVSQAANEKSGKGTNQFVFSAITCCVHLVFLSARSTLISSAAGSFLSLLFFFVDSSISLLCPLGLHLCGGVLMVLRSFQPQLKHGFDLKCDYLTFSNSTLDSSICILDIWIKKSFEIFFHILILDNMSQP